MRNHLESCTDEATRRIFFYYNKVSLKSRSCYYTLVATNYTQVVRRVKHPTISLMNYALVELHNERVQS